MKKKQNCTSELGNVLVLIFLQGLTHFDEILQEADGIILSRGNLGIDLPPEKVGHPNLAFFSNKMGYKHYYLFFFMKDVGANKYNRKEAL